MKNRLVAFMFIIGFCPLAMAQTPMIQIGMNKVEVNVDDNARTNFGYLKHKTTYSIGALVEHQIGKIAYVETGLTFLKKGIFEDYDRRQTSYEYDLTVAYLELPLRIRAHFDAGKHVDFCPYIGPYMAVGLSGHERIEGFDTYGDWLVIKNKVRFGNGDTDIRRFDYGGQIGAGLNYQRLFLTVMYSFGLQNVVAPGERDLKVTYRVTSFSLVYRIGKLPWMSKKHFIDQ